MPQATQYGCFRSESHTYKMVNSRNVFGILPVPTLRLLATRGARTSPNLQVVIMHALHVCR